MPVGHHFVDKYDIPRDRVRVRWWDQDATTYRSAAILSPGERTALPDMLIPEHAQLVVGDKPVFFGHYWLSETPSLQSDRAVCVDYSAGKGGALVAYRCDGEPELSVENFVWVD